MTPPPARGRSGVEAEKARRGAWYAADQDFRFKKAEMDTARYSETAQKLEPKSASTTK